MQTPITGLVVHTRRGASTARSRAGAAAHAAGRRRAPQGDLARAHRDAHGAQGVPRGARRDRDAGGLGERAGPVPVRLLRDRRGARVGAARRRGAGQRPACSTTCGVHAEIMTPGRGRATPARWRCSARSTATQVRVVSVGDWARELCGGTHAQRSGQLGVVKLLGEASIGSGVRRVEALVGADAYRFLAREHVLVAQLTEALKVRPEELPERVDDIVERLRTPRRRSSSAAPQQVLGRRRQLVAGAARRQRRHASSATTRATARRRRPAHAGARRARPARQRPARRRRGGRRGQGPSGRRRGATNEPARERGSGPATLVRVAAQILGGGGGGKDDVAQGGGTDATQGRRGAGAGSSDAVGAARHGGPPESMPHRRTARRRLGRVPGSGVARSDPTGLLATPVETVPRDAGGDADLDAIAAAGARARRPSRSSSGCRARCPGGGPGRGQGPRLRGRAGARIAPVPVRLVDERLTTCGCAGMLRDSGVAGRRSVPWSTRPPRC